MTKPSTEPVTIRSCRDLQEAQIVRGMLEAGGIRAFIPDEHVATLYPTQVLDTNGIRVQVAPEDVELANELLANEAS